MMNENYERESWTGDLKLAPFNKETGSLESYHLPHMCALMKVSEPFRATLLLHDFDKGLRSAHRVVWLDERSNKTYPMFIGKFMDLVNMFKAKPLATFPRISGSWRVCKRGSNYGIELLEVLDDE